MMRNMKVLIQNYEVNKFIVTDKASQIHLTSSSFHKKRILCSAQMYFNHSVGPSNVNTIFFYFAQCQTNIFENTKMLQSLRKMPHLQEFLPTPFSSSVCLLLILLISIIRVTSR